MLKDVLAQISEAENGIDLAVAGKAVSDAVKWIAQKQLDGQKFLDKELSHDEIKNLVATSLTGYTVASLGVKDTEAVKVVLTSSRVVHELVLAGLTLGVKLAIDEEWR